MTIHAARRLDCHASPMYQSKCSLCSVSSGLESRAQLSIVPVVDQHAKSMPVIFLAQRSVDKAKGTLMRAASLSQEFLRVSYGVP